MSAHEFTPETDLGKEFLKEMNPDLYFAQNPDAVLPEIWSQVQQVRELVFLLASRHSAMISFLPPELLGKVLKLCATYCAGKLIYEDPKMRDVITAQFLEEAKRRGEMP